MTDVWCRRRHEEADSIVEGSLAAEVSLITLDMLEIIIQVCHHLLLCVCSVCVLHAVLGVRALLKLAQCIVMMYFWSQSMSYFVLSWTCTAYMLQSMWILHLLDHLYVWGFHTVDILYVYCHTVNRSSSRQMHCWACYLTSFVHFFIALLWTRAPWCCGVCLRHRDHLCQRSVLDVYLQVTVCVV